MSKMGDKLVNNAPAEFLKATTSGVSLGFNKYLEALLAAGILKAGGSKEDFSSLYERGVKGKEALNKLSAEKYPKANLAGELIGSTALPWKIPFKGAPSTIKQSAALGAGYGALAGVGHNTEEGEGLIAGLTGTIPGAALGAGGQYLQNTPLFNEAGKYLKKGVEYLTPKNIQNAMPNNAAAIDNLTTSSVGQGQNLSNLFDVPLTRGEHTQLPEHFMNEEMALRGWEGIPQMEAGKAFQETQKKAFDTAVREKVQNSIANIKNRENALGEAEKGFETKGAHARDAIEELTTKAATEKKLHQQAYKEAGVDTAQLDINDVRKFPLHAEDVLQRDVGVTEFTAPETFNNLKSYEKIFNKKYPKEMGEITGTDIKLMEGWKKGVNESLAGNISPSDRRGLTNLKKIYDDYTNELIETSLLSGDPKSLDKFRNATSIAHNWFKKYGDGNAKDIGQKFIGEMVENAERGVHLTDEQLVNKMLGMSEIGFGPQATSIAQSLKKNISTEGFDQIKLEALERILTPLKSEKPQAVSYLKNLTRLTKQNPTLMKEFFTKKDLGTLKDIGILAHKIYTRPINRVNPSGSAEMLGKIRKLIGSIPVAGPLLETIPMAAGALNRQGTSFNPSNIARQVENLPVGLSEIKKAAILSAINNATTESEAKE